MAFELDVEPERLVKSTERVRDLGEVFTPTATVQEMLDLLPAKIWATHPSPTFLEPACGDGNFLVAILERKLERVAIEFDNGTLAAGTDEEAAQFHALEALASIYAVDISADNVIGGTPGHEKGARTRLLEQFIEWNEFTLGKKLNDRSRALRAAQWTVDHNIIVGNMLPVDAAGKPTGRDRIPIIEYLFDAGSRRVQLRKTSLGDVLFAEQQAVAAEMSLFGPEAPLTLWEGLATQLADAERIETPELKGPVRNGIRRGNQ